MSKQLAEYYERLKKHFMTPPKNIDTHILQRAKLQRETTFSHAHAEMFQQWFAWASMEPRRAIPKAPKGKS